MAAQLISVILIPILSRLYSPEQFGELSLFVSVTGIIAIISTLKLNEAIMLTKSQEEIHKIIGAILFFSISLLIILITLVFISILFSHTVNISIGVGVTLLILLPFNIIGLALYNTNTLYLTKRSLYKNVSYSNINRSLSLNISQLILSVFKNFNGLLLGNVIGNLIGSYHIIKMKKYYLRYVSWKNFKSIIKKYSHFPKFNLPQAILNNTSSALPNLMLIIPFGASSIGLYYMTLKLLNLPTTLVSGVITNLFYQDASEKFNVGENFASYYLKTILMLFSIIILPTIIIVIFGPSLIPIILGPEWSNAAGLIPWIAMWTASIFIYMPATKVIIIQTWQNYALNYNILVFLIRIVILIYGINFLNFIDTIMVISLFNIIWNVLLIIAVGIFLFRKEYRS